MVALRNGINGRGKLLLVDKCIHFHDMYIVIITQSYFKINKSPSWTVIISRFGCQRAVMTAWLCGCWRGAITLKSLVWQAFGVCVCVCVHLWVSDFYIQCYYTSVGLFLSLSAGGVGGWGVDWASSVNVRNRNKAPGLKTESSSREKIGFMHLSSASLILLLFLFLF